MKIRVEKFLALSIFLLVSLQLVFADDIGDAGRGGEYYVLGFEKQKYPTTVERVFSEFGYDVYRSYRITSKSLPSQTTASGLWYTEGIIVPFRLTGERIKTSTMNNLAVPDSASLVRANTGLNLIGGQSFKTVWLVEGMTYVVYDPQNKLIRKWIYENADAFKGKPFAREDLVALMNSVASGLKQARPQWIVCKYEGRPGWPSRVDDEIKFDWRTCDVSRTYALYRSLQATIDEYNDYVSKDPKVIEKLGVNKKSWIRMIRATQATFLKQVDERAAKVESTICPAFTAIVKKCVNPNSIKDRGKYVSDLKEKLFHSPEGIVYYCSEVNKAVDELKVPREQVCSKTVELRAADAKRQINYATSVLLYGKPDKPDKPVSSCYLEQLKYVQKFNDQQKLKKVGIAFDNLKVLRHISFDTSWELGTTPPLATSIHAGYMLDRLDVLTDADFSQCSSKVYSSEEFWFQSLRGLGPAEFWSEATAER